MRRLVALAVILVVALAVVVASLEQRQQSLPLVAADYPQCVTVRPSPLLPPPRRKYEYLVADPARDGGTA